MFDVAQSLQPALREAQRQLNSTANAVAHVKAGDGSTERAMVGAAQAATFEGALLSAMHARCAEVKTVSKQ